MTLSPRDQAALDLATSEGRADAVTADVVAELGPGDAVRYMLAAHLGRVRARLEDRSGAGRHQELAFVRVTDTWPESWKGANGALTYPMAVVTGVVDDELFGMGERPEPDPLDASPEKTRRDWISPDERFALWRRGDAQGEGRVIVFASYEGHASALGAAVRRALQGGVASPGACALPLPEAALPVAFQGTLPASLFPTFLAWPIGSSVTAARDDDAAADSGTWRADVPFKWTAPVLVGRPRQPDYDPRILPPVVTPAP